MRRCKTCGALKPLSEFHFQVGKPVARCKQCVNAARRARYAATRARPRQKKSPEQIGERQAQWRAQNRDKIDANSRRWRVAQPGEMSRKWTKVA